ncbi:flavodoxin/nitric oxide synthase [Promicromonospora sp. NPDC052451]|uniref:flavodoxin/nitric oxide synthase n=1 Tax=Promicromonospora sp. NPDC052451 TaxID=3364407 RepID=UPI0037CAE558
MRVLVVYESIFGNTGLIARAVAAGIELGIRTGVELGTEKGLTAGTDAPARVDVVEVGRAPAVVPEDVGLLVVGGPTHAFGMSWPSTRRDAAALAPKDGEVLTLRGLSRERGIREWLGDLPGTRVGVPTRATTFDTRTSAHLTGSAARAAARRLARLGYPIVAAPASYRVVDVTGPPADGEQGRARAWGSSLGVWATARRGTPAS